MYILCLILLILLWWYLSRSSLPGPLTLPLIGTFWNQSLKHYELNVKKYGSIFRTVGHLGLKKAVVVSDPKMIKYFLVTNSRNFERRPPTRRFNTLFGDGIFNSRGKLWKRQRRLARPFFHSLERHIPTIVRYTDQLLNNLPHSAIDIQEMFYDLTLQIICDIGFGVVDLCKETRRQFNRDFNRAQEIVEENIRNPFLEYLSNYEFESLEYRLSKFTSLIMNRSNSEENLLTMFHDLGCIRDTVLNFIIAGRDTTATLLTWTFFCLALHPKVKNRLKREIKAIPEPLSYGNIKKCKYLRWVLDEVLRLFPPIPVDTRRSIKNDLFPGGFKIPAGTFVVYSAWVMGRHKKYWTDPHTFNPDRWKHKPKHKYAFVPFHAGPQTCMGMHLAYLEASIVLIKLLPRFDFELDSRRVVIPQKSIVLTAKNGMWMWPVRHQFKQKDS